MPWRHMTHTTSGEETRSSSSVSQGFRSALYECGHVQEN